MINELLYKSESSLAHEIMCKDPGTFEEVCPVRLQLHGLHLIIFDISVSYRV